MALGNLGINDVNDKKARTFSGNVVVKVLAQDVAESITVPEGANRVIFSATADFFVKAFGTAAQVANIVTNGAFAADTNWTKGTGWTIAAGVATATGGISTDLSQTPTTDLIEGQAYLVTADVTRSAGGVIPKLGGTSGTEVTTTSALSQVIVAGSGTDITFSGNGFTGTLDNVTVTPVAYVPSADNNTGEGPELVKAASDEESRSFIVTGLNSLSIAAGAATTVTASFFKL